jgi:hypothetical protein
MINYAYHAYKNKIGDVMNIRISIMGMIAILLTLSNVMAYQTVIDVNLDEPFRLYINDELVESTQSDPGRPDQRYTSMYPLISDTQEIVSVRVEANGYSPYSINVKIGEQDYIYIREENLKPLEMEYAQEEIINTRNYLDTLKLKYSDTTYRASLEDAYELLNKAQTEYDSGSYSSAYRYASDAKSLGEDIYNTWDKIARCEDLINECNSKGYDKYCNITEYTIKLNDAKLKFSMRDYESSQETAEYVYLKLSQIVNIINTIESIENRMDELTSKLSDDTAGLHPNIALDIDEDIQNAKNHLANGEYSDATDEIENINITLNNFESSGLRAKKYLLDLHTIYNTTIPKEYKNIDKDEKFRSRYNESYGKYQRAKGLYNEGSIYSSEIYARSSYNEITQLMAEYNDTKNNISNEIDSLHNQINEIMRNNTIDDSILHNINLAKMKLDKCNFSSAMRYLELANEDLRNLKYNLNASKGEITNIKNYIKKRKEDNDGIVFKKAENELNSLESNIANENISTIKEKCEEIKAIVDKTCIEYNISKTLLLSFEHRMDELNKQGWDTHNLLNQYQTMKKLHDDGEYNESIRLLKEYLKEMDDAEKSIKECEDYISTHNTSTKWFGLYHESINYSEENAKLYYAKELFSEGKFNESKKFADDALNESKKKYEETNSGIITKILTYIKKIFKINI